MKTSESYLPRAATWYSLRSGRHFRHSAHCGRRRTRDAFWKLSHSGAPPRTTFCSTSASHRASCRAYPAHSAWRRRHARDCHSVACSKPTCFIVTDIDESTDPPTAWLSRTIVQQKVQDRMLDSLRPGDVIPARVTHLEPFGAFVDAGCGVPSLIGIENLSVSRICTRATD